MGEKRPLIEYFEPILRPYREIEAIVAAGQPEIHSWFDELGRWRDNIFILSSNRYAIERRERIWQIVPPVGSTLQERRFALLARQNERIPYTLIRLSEMLTNLVGVGNFQITLDTNLYTMEVLIDLDSTNNFNAIQQMLRRIVPANIKLETDFWYNRHVDLEPFTHEQLSQFTHWELRYLRPLPLVAPPRPSLSLSVSSINLPTSGPSTQTFVVETNMPWSAESNQPWATLSPNSGTGDTNVVIVIDANPSPQFRQATVTVRAGDLSATITIGQAAAAAYLDVDPASVSITHEQQTLQFNLASNVRWRLSSINPGMTISPQTGSGNATIDVTVAENTSPADRQLELAFSRTEEEGGGMQFIVRINQMGAAPSISLSPTSAEVGPTGMPTTVRVTSNGPWEVSGGAPWATPRATSGTQNQDLTIDYTNNGTLAPREATFTFATTSGSPPSSQNFTLRQRHPQLTFSPSSFDFGAEGGTGRFAATVNVTSVASSDVSWLRFVQSAYSVFDITVDENTDPLPRVGHINFAGSGPGQGMIWSVEVRQEGTDAPEPEFKWRAGPSLPAALNWYKMATSQGKTVAIARGPTNQCAVFDGTEWVLRELPNTADWAGIAADEDGTFIAVAQGTVAARSTDGGETWESIALPVWQNWVDIAFGRNTYGGEVFYIQGSTYQTVLVSTDGGETWLEQHNGQNGDWSCIGFGTSHFGVDLFCVLAANATLSRTTSSALTNSFAPQTLPAELDWYKVRMGLGRAVAIARNANQAAVSQGSPGVWAASLFGETRDCTGLAFGNDVFALLLYNSDRSFLSEDGEEFQQEYPMPAVDNWVDCIWDGEQFIGIAAGSDRCAIGNWEGEGGGGIVEGSGAREFVEFFNRDRVMVGAQAANPFFQNNPGLMDVRYRYLADRVFTGPDVPSVYNPADSTWWGWWQDTSNPSLPPGQILRDFLSDTQVAGLVPMITYYTFTQTAQALGFEESDLAPMNDAAFLTRYFNDWRFMLQQIGQANAIIHIEPDLWGYAMHRSLDAGNENPELLPAAVQAANPTDGASFPSTVAGMARCMLSMARTHAPNAKVGLHASAWATGEDINYNDNQPYHVDVIAHALRCANYMVALGADEADFIAVEASDRDADYYRLQEGLERWWNTGETLPNFEQHFMWARQIQRTIGKPLVWWQLPCGNANSPNVAVTNEAAAGGYRDNRVDQLLMPSTVGRIAELGGALLAFGAGRGDQSNPLSDGGNLAIKADAYKKSNAGYNFDEPPPPIAARSERLFPTILPVSGLADTTFLFNNTGGFGSDPGAWSPPIPHNTPVVFQLRAPLSRVLFQWMASGCYSYNAPAAGGAPTSYLLEASSDNGASYSTIVDEANNLFAARAHIVELPSGDLTHIRFTVRAGGPGGQSSANVSEIDIHNLSLGTPYDTFAFLGDSITADTFWRRGGRMEGPAGNQTAQTTTPPFNTRLNQLDSSRYPSMMNMGIGGWTTALWLQNNLLQNVLAANSGIHYWAIQLGSNIESASAYRANLQQMINLIQAAGHQPIIARIPYQPAQDAAIQSLNAVVDDLTVLNGLPAGPDLYRIYRDAELAGQSMLWDGLHPNARGIVTTQDEWSHTANTLGLV